ncbi:MAG TPA: hypothetical protein VIL00_04235 [Pseudonocardiaceae bacterium]
MTSAHEPDEPSDANGVSGGGADHDEPPHAGPPRAVGYAVGTWLALAVFLLLQNVLVWFSRNALERLLVESGQVPVEQAADAAWSVLVQTTVVTLAFSGLYIWFALMLRRGRLWARTGLTVVGLLQLFLVVVSGGLSPVGMVVLLLVVAGTVLLWRRPVTAWLAEVHS